MEQEQILLNGCILVKNHKNYRNVHYLIQTDNVVEFMKFVLQNEDSIEAVYRSRQGSENLMYVKSTKLMDLKGFNLLEKTEWENFSLIFPWKWDGTQNFLSEVPDITLEKCPPPQENLTASPDFEITEDINQLLHWYKANVRLPDVPIMKETEFDHRKVKTLRNKIFANSIVHFPVFLYGVRHYVYLYFSFLTKYHEVFMNLFAENSAASYLVRGKDGRIFLFVNTTRPGWVLHAMENFEERGIVSNMFFCYLQARWDPIIKDFKSGKIPEKYFWMFGTPKKEEK